jgi:hypothetical protein
MRSGARPRSGWIRLPGETSRHTACFQRALDFASRYVLKRAAHWCVRNPGDQQECARRLCERISGAMLDAGRNSIRLDSHGGIKKRPVRHESHQMSLRRLVQSVVRFGANSLCCLSGKGGN